MSKEFTISGNKIKLDFKIMTQMMESEFNHLLDMAESEALKLMMQGYSEKRAQDIVMGHIQNNTGFAKAFWNRQDRLFREMENKLVAQPVHEYGDAHPDEPLKWVLGEVATHHCPDCLRLSEMEPRTIGEWRAMDTGLPREGKTACSFGCKCMLEPVTAKLKSTQKQKDQTPNLVKKTNKGLFSPIGALEYPAKSGKYRDILDEVMGAIDSVHGTVPMKTIPMTTRVSKSADGCFYHSLNYATGERKPLRINLNPKTNQYYNTIAHEFGHYLDMYAISKDPGISATATPIMSDWLKAVKKTNSYKNIVAQRAFKSKLGMSTGYCDYMLKLKELWARSYAQYIGEKSRNKYIINDTESIRKLAADYQWDSKDFEEVYEAIDQILLKLGWLR